MVVVDLNPQESLASCGCGCVEAALRRGRAGGRGRVAAGRPGQVATVVATRPGGQAEVLERLGPERRRTRRAAACHRRGRRARASCWPAGGAGTGGLAAASRLALDPGAGFAWVPRRARGPRGPGRGGPARTAARRPGRSAPPPAASWPRPGGASCPRGPALTARPRSRPPPAGELGVLVLAGVDLRRDHGPRELADQALERAFVIAVDHEVNDTASQADVLLPGLVRRRDRGRPSPTGGAGSRPTGPSRSAGRPRRSGTLGPASSPAPASEFDLDFARPRPGRPRPGGTGPPSPPPPVGASPSRTPQAVPRREEVPPGVGEPPLSTGVPPRSAAAEARPGPVPPWTRPPPRSRLDPGHYPLLLDAASMPGPGGRPEPETPGAFVELHPDDAGRLGAWSTGPPPRSTSARARDGLQRRSGVALYWSPPACAFVPANQPDSWRWLRALPCLALGCGQGQCQVRNEEEVRRRERHRLGPLHHGGQGVWVSPP